MSKPSAKSHRRPQHDLLRQPYARVLLREDDGTYSADILEFPGCHAEGDTPDEAISNLESAAASWIEAALEQGQTIPPPTVVHGYSGSINLRLPKSIHKQAARFAAMEKVSLNQFFSSAIAARVGAEEFCEHLLQRFQNRFLSVSIKQVVQNLNVAIPLESPDALRPEYIQSTSQEMPRLPVETIKEAANG